MENDKKKQEEALERIAFSDEFSRPIDVHRWSDYPEVDKVVAHVMGELEAVIPDELKRNRKKYENNVKVAILDLYVAFLQAPADGLWIGVPRKRANQLALRFRKLHISGLMIMKVIDALKDLGYARIIKGKKFYAPDGTTKKVGRQSRAQATMKLISLLADFDINDRMITSSHDEIYLRKKITKKRKVDVDIIKTAETERLRAEVRFVNEALAQADIKLVLSKGDLVRLQHRLGWRRPNFRLALYGTAYRRIYNQIGDDQAFCFGGRWYGHWCLSIPSEYRKHITINGEPTVELDYGGLHIRMLYDREGIPQPVGDPYSYPRCAPGKVARKIRKVIMQTIINAETPEKAIRGAVKAFKEDGDLPNVSRKEVKQIAHDLMSHHAPIKRYFCSGEGVALQHLDAEVARDILMTLAAEGVPCLPVHDSFIVGVSHEDRLWDLMYHCYCTRLKGGEPVIDRKG